MQHRFIVVLLFILFTLFFTYQALKNLSNTAKIQEVEQKTADPSTNLLAIETMRARKYEGSDIKIEEELAPSANYKEYIASYLSDGLKIYGLLTIPSETSPDGGFPVIIFNHGYIAPEDYRTDERYVAYVDGFARNGYVVFKPDYRGHGNSEGRPEGAYFSPAYTVDVLNAVASIRKLKEVNPNRIGMWGHSLSGSITVRSMVISRDIKAGVIWAGVVGTYQEIFDEWWSRRVKPPFTPSEREKQANRPTRQSFIEKFGEPDDKNEFWRSISPNFYLKDISGPIQLHHGTADETVPNVLSEKLYNRLKNLGKEAEYYTYEGADHNLASPAFELAMQRSVEFFDKHLK